MAKFESKGGKLYIDGFQVIKGWESYTGQYWFAVRKVQTQDSIINGKLYPNDTIYYGLVQGLAEEWGDFSEAEIKHLGIVWKIRSRDLPYAGRRQSE